MPSALRALLAELIDYAELFPPAALPMADVAANFAEYRASPDRWALGRLIVPAARLRELSDAYPPGAGGDPWRVSALIGNDVAADARSIAEASTRDAGRIVVDTVEIKASTPTAIDVAVRAFDEALTVYVEIPVLDDPHPLVERIARGGARAKIRTGGVTPDVFPTTPQVARFISACVANDLAFKATAGLHHPIRGEYPLTYHADAPYGTMFGFLNVFLAAAHARAGMPAAKLSALLDERSPAALHVTGSSIAWCDTVLSTDDIIAARRFAVAFGSCSFREPIDDLQRLGLRR